MNAYYMTAEGQVFRTLSGESTQGYTPVAVIDPEDRTQVERLLYVFANALNWGPNHIQRTTYADPLQAALREFANPTPPKPDEPTGIGAVVEDAYGARWVRLERPVVGAHWHNYDHGTRRWSDVAAVGEPLSEGVTP